MARILIVDDANFIRVTLEGIFKQANHEVVGTARNGKEAIALYKQKAPDIVTLDITMPVMDGIEALKQIRQFDAEAKVIMCSAMGQQKTVVKAIELGAKDFIVKPFDENRVLETVERVLNQTD